MAIDTRQKRSSIVHMGCPWRSQLPIGDGTFGQADRQQILAYYAGIEWGEAEVGTLAATWHPRKTSDRTLKPAGNNERVFTTRVDITRNK